MVTNYCTVKTVSQSEGMYNTIHNNDLPSIMFLFCFLRGLTRLTRSVRTHNGMHACMKKIIPRAHHYGYVLNNVLSFSFTIETHIGKLLHFCRKQDSNQQLTLYQIGGCDHVTRNLTLDVIYCMSPPNNQHSG